MRGGDRGSAFIEALAATAIVAGVLAVTFETLVAADQRGREIADRRTALMIARSELAQVGSSLPVTPGDVEGSQAGFNWRVSIEPGEADTTIGAQVGPPALVTVAVWRASGGGNLVVLKTMRTTAGS
jgi:general secretion pathway protein I